MKMNLVHVEGYMRKSLLVTISLVLLVSFGFSETIVSVVGSSVPNGTTIAAVPINLTNTEAVGGLQFSLKDVPNQFSVAAVAPAGRAGAEPFEDFGIDQTAGNGDFGEGDGLYTPGEAYTDVNGNNEWDGPFSVEFNDRDSTVSVLIFDASGNSLIPGNGPVCTILFSIPTTVSDEIVDLRFHEILDADPQFLLVVTDPAGNAVNTTWLNGFLTVGGIEVTMGPVGGSPGYLSVPLSIEMSNAVPVKGIQFNIVDAVDLLTIAEVQGVGRGANFTFVGNEVAGQSMVLGVNFAGEEIPAGTGAIVEVIFMVDPSATTGTSINLGISQLIVAAQGGIPLPSNGGTGVFSVNVGIGDENEMPEKFELSQNYPNPFNPTTTIAYSVPEASEVRLGIYNMLGQEIRTLAVGDHQPGYYSTLWDGLDKNGVRVESGVYLYRMSSSAGFGATRKLVLLK